MDLAPDHPAVAQADSVRVLRESRGEVTYRLTVRDPLRPDVRVQADLATYWDPMYGSLWVTLVEPRSGSGRADRADVRELLVSRVVRPLQEAGVQVRGDL